MVTTTVVVGNLVKVEDNVSTYYMIRISDAELEEAAELSKNGMVQLRYDGEGKPCLLLEDCANTILF